MRISDWSSDVCSSDLNREGRGRTRIAQRHHRLVEAHREALDRAVADSWRGHHHLRPAVAKRRERGEHGGEQRQSSEKLHRSDPRSAPSACEATPCARRVQRSEEHTSELQSLMRISYAVFCLKKKKTTKRKQKKD